MNSIYRAVIFITVLSFAYFDSAASDNKLRHFIVYDVPEAGLIAYKPGSPEWNIDIDDRKGNDAILLSTPEFYFPPTSVEIRLDNNFDINSQTVREVGKELNIILRRKTNADNLFESGLSEVTYGNIEAVTDQFDVSYQGKMYTIKHIVGRMPSGKIITMVASTAHNQIEEVEHMLSKIYSNLRERL